MQTKNQQTIPAPLSVRGLCARLVARLGGMSRSRPRLALLERIALAPRHALMLVEAEGRRFLVLDAEGQLPVLLLDPALEDEILATLAPDGARLLTAAAPGAPLIRRLTDSVNRLIGSHAAAAPPCSSVRVRRATTSSAGSNRRCPGWRWLPRPRYLRKFASGQWAP